MSSDLELLATILNAFVLAWHVHKAMAEGRAERTTPRRWDMEIKIKALCKPFTAFGRGRYNLLVDVSEQPRVRVWDGVGQIYTVCHALSAASQRSIVAKARKLAAQQA